MRSIRLSLIVYFVVLLLAALGGISYFCYQSTQQALEAKEQSTRKQFTAKYEDNCEKVRKDFDREVLVHASSIARKVVSYTHHYEALLCLGMINSNMHFQGHLQAPLWLGESIGPVPSPLYNWLRDQRPREIRIPDEDMDDLLTDREYYQIYRGDRPRAGQLDKSGQPTDKSDNLPDWWVLSEEARGMKDRGWLYDTITLPSGDVLRRVTVRSPIWIRDRPGMAFTPVRVVPPKGPFKFGPGGNPPSFKGGSPQIYVQYATKMDRLDQDLALQKGQLDGELVQLRQETHAALADLRTRMLWISLGAFAAVVIGGFVLVRVGLSPLHRLTEAVRQVSAKDFRLAIDQQRLPNELKPIAARLQETLGELKRTFSREKQSVADISHELRTPVASLLATLEVALKKPRSPEEYREFLSDCRTAGQQMSQLVERLLALARLDAGVDRMRPRDVDMTEVVRQCASLVRPLAEAKGVNLRLHLNGPVSLHADPDKLREILTNLLHNAIEYNKPQGSIDLQVGRDNGHVRVEVKDTGIGIPPEMRAHIFERFYRGDPSRHTDDGIHAGLGLAIVKGYVDLMGGSIGVESSDAGSTFRVDLPVRTTAA